MATSPDSKSGPSVRAFLSWRDGSGREARVELSGAEVYIGRQADCAVQFDDAMVSRRHARVFLDGGRWHVEDLGSAGSMLVNDRRVARYALAPGDEIRCSSHRVRYQEEPGGSRSAPGPLAPLVAPVLRVLAGEIAWIDDPRTTLDGRARFRGGVHVSGTGREDWVFDSGAQVSRSPATAPVPESVRIDFPDGRVVEIAGAGPWFAPTGPFQRRGLPHAEIAALLEDGWSPGGTSESWAALPAAGCLLHVRAGAGGWAATVEHRQG